MKRALLGALLGVLSGSFGSLSLLLLASLVSPPAATAQEKSLDVAVIVNPNNPMDNLTSPELRKIFMGEKHNWPNKAPVKLLVGPQGSRDRFVMLKLIGMSDSEYKQFWIAEVVRGEADAEPLMLPSFGMVKEAAIIYPGAIALVEFRNIKPGMLIKVVRVDGRLPGEQGYPLH
jgi:ABC-type phosphate transport system substrate-binding protein